MFAMWSFYYRAFVAGSSFPGVIIPLTYMGIATTLTPESGLHYFSEVLSIIFLFWIFNILFLAVRKYFPTEGINDYWVFGWLHGLVFSLLWNFWLGVPEKLFHLSGWMQYLTIPTAIILYACIWRYGISGVNSMLNLEEK